MNIATRRLACLAVAVLAGCGGKAPPPASEAPAAAVAPVPLAPLTEADLVAAIRDAAGTDLGDAHYFDATVDLDGDGSSEKVVYVAGPMLCGTGGCPMFVFGRGQDGYRLVARLSVVQPPVRISPRSSKGWRNLVVGVGGGGLAAGNAELKFDGSIYPSNPTVAPAEPVSDLAGTEVLIPEFGSYTDGKVIDVPDAPPPGV